MSEIAIVTALHVLGVVWWIGGLAFVTAVLLPELRGDPAHALERFHAIERRFAPQVRAAVLLVGASGGWMLYRPRALAHARRASLLVAGCDAGAVGAVLPDALRSGSEWRPQTHHGRIAGTEFARSAYSHVPAASDSAGSGADHGRERDSRQPRPRLNKANRERGVDLDQCPVPHGALVVMLQYVVHSDWLEKLGGYSLPRFSKSPAE